MPGYVLKFFSKGLQGKARLVNGRCALPRTLIAMQYAMCWLIKILHGFNVSIRSFCTSILMEKKRCNKINTTNMDTSQELLLNYKCKVRMIDNNRTQTEQRKQVNHNDVKIYYDAPLLSCLLYNFNRTFIICSIGRVAYSWTN